MAEDVDWRPTIKGIPNFGTFHVAYGGIGISVEIVGKGSVDFESEVVLYSPKWKWIISQ